MSKNKLVKINYYNNSNSPSIVCSDCGYTTRSETGMRLHRKVKHNKTKDFLNSSVSYLCCGCRVLKSECKCKK